MAKRALFEVGPVFLVCSIKQNKSAQPAYFRFGSKASWADLFRLIEPAKMAENFFGGFILV